MSSVLTERVLTAPQTLILDPPMSDEEFDRLCRENKALRIERTREGVIVMNPPTGFLSGDANAEIIHQLRSWWHTHRRGRVVESNTMLKLPDGTIQSPDAAYVAPEQLDGLTREALNGVAPICPVFVIELLSQSDRVEGAKRKMLDWQKNGAALGWLIDPYRKAVHVYAAGQAPLITTATTLTGSGPVEGFALNLEEVYRCFEV